MCRQQSLDLLAQLGAARPVDLKNRPEPAAADRLGAGDALRVLGEELVDQHLVGAGMVGRVAPLELRQVGHCDRLGALLEDQHVGVDLRAGDAGERIGR